ncbi:GNAT family N-acetyltransferase [Bacillus suaedae]|uniref:GNAT family N-acetyltransferase n=1 Tax=Halalkalibacter suaedae TaxID=2822140 RepID=A0A940WT87_9BACI|nr:GNAT family N-acetyltransferase [Bacillus suaedae]MBP3950222.1 GNAT family N-acetyltransferase [Bacillus suaedae]
MDFTIRNATEQDAENIIIHMKKVLTENPDYLGTTLDEFTPTVEEEREWIRKHSEQGLMLVAESNHVIIGMLQFRLSQSKRFCHKGSLGITVQEAYTNHGVGSALLKTLIVWAKKEERIEKITLEVFSNNERAIGLYSKLGFVEEGRMKKNAKLGPDHYVDDIIMSLFL